MGFNSGFKGLKAAVQEALFSNYVISLSLQLNVRIQAIIATLLTPINSYIVT